MDLIQSQHLKEDETAVDVLIILLRILLVLYIEILVNRVEN